MEYLYLLLLGFIVSVNGCTNFGAGLRSSNGSEPDEMKVYYSHRVIFAKVIEKKVDPVFSRPGVQAVTVDIICIYKGGMLPKRITIVGTGRKP